MNLSNDQLEFIIDRLTVDEVPRHVARPFTNPFPNYSDKEVTINGKTLQVRILNFADTLQLTQTIPQAFLYLFGDTPERIASNMDPVNFAYTVFFHALTDRVDGQLTKFAMSVLELFCGFLSGDIVLTPDDLLQAKGHEPILAFQVLVAVNADFFSALPLLIPSNIKRAISTQAGNFGALLNPIKKLIGMGEKALSQTPESTEDAAGGTPNGGSTATNTPLLKPDTPLTTFAA